MELAPFPVLLEAMVLGNMRDDEAHESIIDEQIHLSVEEWSRI
jgi:hypothetical protein